MLSNNQKKFLNSLKQKKYRNLHSMFIVEGEKLIKELVNSDFEIVNIFGAEDLLSYTDLVKINERELSTISQLKTPNKYLAVVKQKQSLCNDFKGLTLLLDGVKDPGNLGTIIRIADWFGISNIVCSCDCVDIYNFKVIQSTMGSIFRVNVFYKDLKEFIETNKDKKVYGAVLGGENVYEITIQKEDSFLVMGNESNGISKEIIKLLDNKISIPQFGSAESLNVAIATSILCSEYRRGF